MRPKNQKSFLQKTAILPVALGLFLSLVSSAAIAGGISPEEVVKLVNRSRTENNLPTLTNNAKLAAAAKAKADDMIKNDYFAHTSPTGVAPWAWMKQSGYQYKYAGENLAINFTNAKEEHSAWMKSKTHRDNILNQKYTEVGVAVVTGKIDGESSIVTVQMFGTPMVAVAETKQPIAPVTVAAPVPTVQGMETETLSESLPVMESIIPAAPTKSESSALLPADRKLAMLPVGNGYDYVAIVMLLVIGLALLSSPTTFLWRAYRNLFLVLMERLRSMRPISIVADTKA